MRERGEDSCPYSAVHEGPGQSNAVSTPCLSLPHRTHEMVGCMCLRVFCKIVKIVCLCELLCASVWICVRKRRLCEEEQAV